jgi:hypothetical protein
LPLVVRLAQPVATRDAQAIFDRAETPVAHQPIRWQIFWPKAIPGFSMP